MAHFASRALPDQGRWTRPPSPRTRTLWANVPWRGPLGRYVAIRVISFAEWDRQPAKEELLIAVSKPGSLQWLPAERCLSPAAAERWARIGFA